MADGCGGRICRACRPIMHRMTLIRSPRDENGEPAEGDVLKGWVCGFVCSPDTTGLRFDLPGKTGGELVRMVVAASSLSPLAVGDEITDGGAHHTVVSVAADGSVMLRAQC